MASFHCQSCRWCVLQSTEAEERVLDQLLYMDDELRVDSASEGVWLKDQKPKKLCAWKNSDDVLF